MGWQCESRLEQTLSQIKQWLLKRHLYEVTVLRLTTWGRGGETRISEHINSVNLPGK